MCIFVLGYNDKTSEMFHSHVSFTTYELIFSYVIVGSTSSSHYNVLCTIKTLFSPLQREHRYKSKLLLDSSISFFNSSELPLLTLVLFFYHFNWSFFRHKLYNLLLLLIFFIPDDFNDERHLCIL